MRSRLSKQVSEERGGVEEREGTEGLTWSLSASLRDAWTASSRALVDRRDPSGAISAGTGASEEDDDDDDGVGRSASSTVFSADTSRPTLLHHTAVLCLVRFILLASRLWASSPATKDA